MLVLSRKVGEKIVIGENITITVQRVAGGRVSLAVEAPRDVRILRGELSAFGGKPSSSGVPRVKSNYQPADDHAALI